MKISIEADYAIRIILYMFKRSELMSGIEIVKKCEIPEQMGLKILTKLTKNGLLNSVKGKNGGFYFPLENLDISLFDIINIFDGLSINKCLSSAKNWSYKKGNCVICNILKEVNNDIVKKFSKIFIKDLWLQQNNIK